MSENLKSKCVLIWDSGLFIEIAIRLAKDFGRVLYFCPWTEAFPTGKALLIGHGVKEIERVEEPWSHMDDVDLVVFPDVYQGALQEYLVSQGKRVWGCRMGCELELDRAKAKEIAIKAGIDIGPYEVIKGLDALREHLKEHDDQHIKVSATRGDFETFHSPTYKKIEPRLDDLEHTLGARKKIIEFIVEEGISPAIEAGYDGYTVDGKYPDGAIIGIEIKDRAYVGCTMRYGKMPEPVRRVNDGLAPALKKYGYRGFISTEVRCTPDGGAYLVDMTCRGASPPSELYQNMISNLGEVMWYGAEGLVVEPDYIAKWGAQVILSSDWADDNWQQISFPKSIRDNVKLRNFCVIDGEYYVIPQSHGAVEIGAVVATGDTAAEAIAECKRIAKLVEGYSVEAPVDAMDEALAGLKKLLADTKEEPKPPLQRKAEEMFRAGKISAKQLDKMVAAK